VNVRFPNRIRRGGGNPAFTLIEIMLVVGILGVLLGVSVPSFYQALKKEPMRKALVGVSEACEMARAQASLNGKTVSVNFQPQERTFSVEGGAAGKIHPGAISSGAIDDSIGIEMLDVNLIEFREAESARVRFFANGTSDEFTLILRSSGNNWFKLTVEPATGNVAVGGVQ
jgi:prepilin-type N-terminal cleavage/methylation domain-containing protein